MSRRCLLSLLITSSLISSTPASAQEPAKPLSVDPFAPADLPADPPSAPSNTDGIAPYPDLPDPMESLHRAAPRGLNGERLDFAHSVELAGWLGFLTLMTPPAILVNTAPNAEINGALGFALFLGLPAVVAGSTLLIFDDGITSAAAQSVNSVSIWAALNVLVFEDDLLDEDHNAWPTLGAATLAGWLGVGAGALTYHLLEPSSGRIGAINSGGIFALGVHTALSLGFDDPYGDVVGRVIMNSGLVAGLLLHSLRPLSREEIVLADGAGLISGLLGILIGSRINRSGPRGGYSSEDPRALAIGWSIASVAGFTTAYLLLSSPDDAATAPPAGVGLSLVAGDSLYYEPGRPQGGAGLMLNVAW